MKGQKEIVGSISLEEIWAKEGKKALNKVKKFKDDCCMFGSSDIEIDRELNIIEKRLEELTKISKALNTANVKFKKAIKILNEKNVNLKWLEKCSNSTQYNLYGMFPEDRLSPQEFKSLKGVFK